MNLAVYSNYSTLWARMIISEFRNNNIKSFFLAPGSQSAPLAKACDMLDMYIYPYFEERGIAYEALGFAKATREYTVIVTTSGTAVANLFPAIIEAYQTHIPLIVLTADRPESYVGTDANQTIDQKNIFGKYADFIQLPEACNINDPLVGLEMLSKSLQNLKDKPLHINVPFSKPLYPNEFQIMDDEWLQKRQEILTKQQTFKPIVQISKTEKPKNDLSNIAINKDKICVWLLGGGINVDEMELLKNNCIDQVPSIVFADAQSGFYGTKIFAHDIVLNQERVINFFSDMIVIQVGNRFISNSVKNLINNKNCVQYKVTDYPDKSIQIDNEQTCFLDITEFATSIFPKIIKFSNKESKNNLVKNAKGIAETLTIIAKGVLKELINPNVFDEFSVAQVIADNKYPILLGNSLSCRVIDYMPTKFEFVYSNRGASGIDGLIATACGISVEHGICVAVIGDISALHDLSSFALLNKCRVVLVILNNNGGNIFSSLQSPDDDDTLDIYFEHPHNTNFNKIAEMFNIEYVSVDNPKKLKNQISRTDFRRSVIIECKIQKDQGALKLKNVRKLFGNIQNAPLTYEEYFMSDGEFDEL